MKKKLILAAAVLGFLPSLAMGQNTVRPVKNIILMISDGTSLSSVSLARWMQFYRNPANQKLNLDPYLCGTVRTSSSNAPIGDSAPTTSCYMSGQPSISGFVSTYPYSCRPLPHRHRPRLPTDADAARSGPHQPQCSYGPRHYLRVPARHSGRLFRA